MTTEERTEVAAGDRAGDGTSRTTPSARRLRLHGWHESRGARFRSSRGHLVPARYGDADPAPPRAGLLDLSDHDRLELVGADRHRFLGGLVTCAVADLAAGSGAYGFVTSIKGKVLADVVVSAFEDRLFLLLPPGRGEAVAEHLRRYVVADRVEVLPLEDLLPVALVGGQAEQRLRELGSWPQAGWGCGLTELFDTQLPVTRHERLGVPGLVAWISSSILEPVVDDLVAGLGLDPVGRDALDDLRVVHGLPAFGIDYDENTLPQETSIGAVDFTKGCYLGQEVVARLHYRGQAPRLLRRLRLEGREDRDPSVELPAEVRFDDRPAGAATTRGHAGGAADLLLAMVQRRAAEPGSVVEVGAGLRARVEAWDGDTPDTGTSEQGISETGTSEAGTRDAEAPGRGAPDGRA